MSHLDRHSQRTSTRLQPPKWDNSFCSELLFCIYTHFIHSRIGERELEPPSRRRNLPFSKGDLDVFTKKVLEPGSSVWIISQGVWTVLERAIGHRLGIVINYDFITETIYRSGYDRGFGRPFWVWLKNMANFAGAMKTLFFEFDIGVSLNYEWCINY